MDSRANNDGQYIFSRVKSFLDYYIHKYKTAVLTLIKCLLLDNLILWRKSDVFGDSYHRHHYAEWKSL